MDILCPFGYKTHNITSGNSKTEADRNVRAPNGKMKRKISQRIYQIVQDKRAWEGPREPDEAAFEAAIGSKGWTTRGFLPHYDKPGTLQMFTFRLADAMPASLRHEWDPLIAITDERERRTKLEAYLDQGRGECALREAKVAKAVEAVFLRGDGQHYRMIAWVVMPNHAHILVELGTLPMDKLLKVWKGTSANEANRVLNRQGTFWLEEYWDRYMRDEEHFRKAKHYLEWNPVKAGLVRTPEAWAFGSANPRWQWSAVDRYISGQLLNPPGTSEFRSQKTKRTNCQEADRNVRAPIEI
jgi:putative transposase